MTDRPAPDPQPGARRGVILADDPRNRSLAMPVMSA